jgi:outer membrane lipoprotein-sorting protein
MWCRPGMAACVFALWAFPGAAQTVDEVVARNIEARGGAARIKAVTSLRMTGHMTIAPGLEAPSVLEMKRPGRMRLDLELPEFTATQVYDGEQGWELLPFRGDREPRALRPEDAASAAERADMDGPLVDYRDKGHHLELLGREPVDGRDAFKLRLTLKNGHEQTVYIDAASYLEIRGESTRNVEGTQIVSEQKIGDYREVGGLLFPHSFENGVKGRPQRQRVTIETIEIDVPIDDARFAWPADADTDESTGDP